MCFLIWCTEWVKVVDLIFYFFKDFYRDYYCLLKFVFRGEEKGSSLGFLFCYGKKRVLVLG